MANLCEDDWLVLNYLDTAHQNTLNTDWKHWLSSNYIHNRPDSRPILCSRLHRMNRFARGTESLTVACGLMDGLSPSSVRVFKSLLFFFFTELCIAAVFLTFSNTQLQITVQLKGWTRTNLHARHARNSLDNNRLTLLSIKFVKNYAKTHFIYFSYFRCYNSSLIVLKYIKQ